MNQPLAYLGDRFLPAAQAVIPVQDAGFMQGTTIAEQLRTFNGKLFRLNEHLERLAQSMEIVGVRPKLGPEQLAEIAQHLVQENHALLQEGDDLGLSMFITPGTYATFCREESEPLVGMHTYAQPFGLWAQKYTGGESLRVSGIRQVPSDCWPLQLKCRSRMHYYLADQEARRAEPGARALLLDLTGHVAEASTASLVIFRSHEGIIAPPIEKTLPGISIGVLAELAAKQDIPLLHRELLPDDIAAAEEVFLCSTSPCLLPVTRFEGHPIGSGSPGPVFRQTLDAWSQLVGLDIQAQAEQFAVR